MAQTLIETPFPTTAEVARALGVSLNRVRRIERMMFPNSASKQVTSSREGRKAAKRASGGKTSPVRQ